MAIPINELVCRPITSYSNIMEFLQNPPPWRSLCEELTPHSEFVVVNATISGNQSPEEMTTETPPAFCHFEPDAEMTCRDVKENLPKTLVCHDMANGYHDDSFIEGTGAADAYTFSQWAGVDVFCYFSHNFITVPPVGWINAAHRHGVTVIGTVITEWGAGAALWDRVLAAHAEWTQFASALVAIAKLMKFDGWLLNIENEVARPDTLVQFVQYLHGALHAELPHAQLIWYDSVTVHGKLQWQNALNGLNEAFFMACDGIFTNYAWREADVARSCARAGPRRTHVYVGVDVWGRNFYGGGMFNTHQAVRIAHKHGCSLAVFAPAWTREAIADDELSAADTLDLFLLRDRALWTSLWPYLHTRLPAALPFHTSFCRGLGKKRWEYGEVQDSEPWFNLRLQQYQPNSALGPHGYIVTTLGVAAGVSQDLKVSRATNVELRKAIVSMESNDGLALHNEEEEAALSLNRGTIAHVVRKKRAPGIPADATPLIVKTYDRLIRLTENLSLQGLSTDTTNLALVELGDEKQCLQVYLEDSFIGGSCLQINPSDETSPEHRLIRLFHCDFAVLDSLIACVVTKTLPDFLEQSLDVQLLVLAAGGAPSRVVLRGLADEDEDTGSDVINVFAANASRDDHVFADIQRYLLKYEPDFYVPTENNNDWDVRYYKVALPGSQLLSVSCRSEYSEGGILLGYIGFAHMNEIHSMASPNS